MLETGGLEVDREGEKAGCSVSGLQGCREEGAYSEAIKMVIARDWLC